MSDGDMERLKVLREGRMVQEEGEVMEGKMESDEDDILDTVQEEQDVEEDWRECMRYEREEVERVEVERETEREEGDESEGDEIFGEEKLRREHVRKIIPGMLPEIWLEELVEVFGSADDGNEVEALEQHLRYSNDAVLKAYGEAEEIKQMKRKRGRGEEYQPEDMKGLISQVAEAFSVHKNDSEAYAPVMTEALQEGRVYYMSGTEHLAATVEGGPQQDAVIAAGTQHQIGDTIEGGPLRDAVVGTQHVTKQDVAEQEGQRPKLIIRLKLRRIDLIEQAADKLDAQDPRAAIRPAFASDELQPGDIFDHEVLDLAMRASVEEYFHTERLAREKLNYHKGESSASQPNRGMLEEQEDKIRIAPERSEVDHARARETARDVEHHHQDAEQEQEDEAAMARRRKGKGKLDDI